MMIRKHDTNGTKSALIEGELGYDKQGSDRGRVYVGTNTGNKALATKAEVDSKVDSSLIGSANGVASLDSNGKVLASQLPAISVGAMTYKGVWNASSNEPQIPLGFENNKGHYYKVSHSGSTNIDGISEWNVGDWIISNGVSWDKIDNTDSITSVNGMSGAVVLTKNDIGLGNLTNILDSQRCVFSATKLSTARNINGVPFDGTTDINIATVDAYTKTETNACLALKQNNLVSGTNIKTVNGSSILGSGNITIASGGTWGSITGTVSSQTDLQSCFNSKQNSLVSGTNIKTINGQSIVGSGDFVISSTGVTTGALSDKSITCINLGKSTIPTGIYTHCATSYTFPSTTYTKSIPGSTCITGLTTLHGSVDLGSFNYQFGKVNNANPGYDSKCLLTVGEYYYSVKGKEELACSKTYLLAFKIKVISNVLTVCLLKSQTQLTTIIDSYSSLDPCLFFNYAVACDQFFTPTSNDGISSLNVSYCSTTIGVNPSFAIDDTCFIVNGITDGQSLKYSASSKSLTPYTPLSGVSSGLTNTSGVLSIDSACNTKWNSKQESLVSGTNIKTVNGTSLLGSGDISIAASLTLDQISNVVVCPNGPVGSGVLIRCLNAIDCWEESSEFYRNTDGFFLNIPTKTMINCNSYIENKSCYCIANSITNAYGKYCNVVFSPSTNNSSSAELRICNTAVMTGSSSGTIQMHDIICSSYLVNKLSISNTNLLTDTSCNTINNTNIRCICATVADSVSIFDNETYNYALRGKYNINRTYNTCCGCVYINQLLNSSTVANCMFALSTQSVTPTSNVYAYESCVANNIANEYRIKLYNNANSVCRNKITFDAGTGSLLTTNSDYVNMFANCKYSLVSPTVDISSAIVACSTYTAIRFASADFICIPNSCCITTPVFGVGCDTNGCGTIRVGGNICASSICTKFRGFERCDSDNSVNIYDTRVYISSGLGGTNIYSCYNNTYINSNIDINLNSGYVFGTCTTNGSRLSLYCDGNAYLGASATGTLTLCGSIVNSTSCSAMVLSTTNTVSGYIRIAGGFQNCISSCCNYIYSSIATTICGNIITPSIVAAESTCLSCSTTLNKVYKIANMLMIGNGCSINSSCSDITAIANNSIMVYKNNTCNFGPRTPDEFICDIGLSSVVKNYNAGINGMSCISLSNSCTSISSYNANSTLGQSNNNTYLSSTSVYGCSILTVTNSGSPLAGNCGITDIITSGDISTSTETITGRLSSTKTINLYSSNGCRNNFNICGLPTTISDSACSLWIDPNGYIKIGTCANSYGLSVSVCNVVYTATANQTIFTLPLSSPTLVDVFLNGLKLPSTCYTLNSTNITFATGITLDDIIDINMIKIG